MSSKLTASVEELAELLELLGTFGRPDASGDRMGFTGRKKMPTQEPEDYPYDPEDAPFYGQPEPYDRGSGGRSAFHAQVLLPHDVSHSAWDDVEEAMGTPYFLKKAYQGAQMGHATGIPGADGGWANNPMKPWDEKDDDDDERLSRYGESGYLDMTINPAVPPAEPTPNKQPEYRHDQTDDELEKRLDRIWHRDDNPNFADPDQMGGGSMLPSDIFIVPSPQPFSGVTGLRTSRGRLGLIPKESVWMSLARLLKNS